MYVAVQLVTNAIVLLLAGLAVLGMRTWRRDHDRSSAWFAGAAGFLGIAVLSDLFPSTNAGDTVAGVALAGSAYSLLRYRDALFPLKRATLWAASLLTVLVALLLLGVGVAPARGLRAVLQAAGVAGLLVVVVGFIAEPVIRFWMLSRGRAVIQRARARAISYGYGGMLLILVVSAVADPDVPNQPFELGTALAILAVVALLYVSFAPPRVLRRIWREHEERALLSAAPLFGTHARTETAALALLRAIRLAGAEAGFVKHADGELLALQEMTADEATHLHAELGHSSDDRIVRVGGRQLLVVPVPLEAGTGILAVVGGPLSPRFLPEELEVIGHYAKIAGLALDHAGLDELRSAFLTSLSHELRTPLTVIVGNAQTLARPGMEDVAADTRKQLLDRLVAQTKVLQRKLEELLELDRGSRGLHLPRRRLVDMEQAVEQAVDRIGARDLRTVEVSVKPMLVGLDPAMLGRILESLLLNAIKHTPADSTIWVRVGREHEGILIAVEDDGPGVPPEFRTTIFEPFHRGPRAPQHAPGTAVALALVGRLAALHAGRAWVEERDGGGASFRVILRTARELDQAGPG